MAPTTADVKRWTTIRALACRAGVITYRSDPLDGPVAYFTVRFGIPKMHADLDAVADYVAGVEQIARCAA